MARPITGIEKPFGLRNQTTDVPNALFGDLRLAGDLKNVRDDAGSVEPYRLFYRVIYHVRKKRPRELPYIDVRDIGPQNQRRASPFRKPTGNQCACPESQLDRIGRGRNKGFHGCLDVLDAGKK